MITLGIETSCDETAVAVLNGRKVLSDCVASSISLHSKYGGVVPEIASRSHLELLTPVLDEALKKAKTPLKRVGLIAVTAGPGLLGSLLVGVSAAKSLSLILGKPLVAVDHVLAHAFSGQMMRKRFFFPFMALVVSGGHTLLIYWKSLKSYRIIGKTFDDAAGEAFDKVAKMMGLGYPGGPKIDRLAKKADSSKYHFPRPWIREKHYNFSFSGLKTAVLYKLRDIQAQRSLTSRDIEEVASSFQEASCEVLVSKALRACRDFKIKKLVVGGGVSANSRLRELFGQEASNGVEVIFPSMNLALDNAVMIAFLGQSLYKVQGKRRRNGSQHLFRAYSDFFVQKSGKIT